MKKEAEIKLIEQIGELLEKLVKADSYFADELKHYNFGKDDMQIMVQNIKKDFPLTFQTEFRKRFERTVLIYRTRCHNLAKMVRSQQFSIRTYENSINELETDNKALVMSRNEILAEALKLTLPGSGYDDYEDLLSLFPDDLVISMKLDMNYPLTSDEKLKVKTALNYR